MEELSIWRAPGCEGLAFDPALQIKSNHILLVTYTYLADVIEGVVKCLCSYFNSEVVSNNCQQYTQI
jgi:hypothetical protein